MHRLMGGTKVVDREGVGIEYGHAPVEKDEGHPISPRTDEMVELDT